MRLLEHLPSGEIRLVGPFADDETPPYAILSHRWDKDESKEVSFEDMREGCGRDKAGYRKIDFCAGEAARHGLRYFWIDTCCINKSYPGELQEAIKSMFRWYHRAEGCYVLLSDVSAGNRKRHHDGTEITWKESFAKSEWFRRGWTLQELLASRSVEFFAGDGTKLGDKISLLKTVYDITGISSGALQGQRLTSFDIEVRFAWMETRRTTKEEDKVYALLGIFDVEMSIHYGEGYTAALQRLRSAISEQDRIIGDLRSTDPCHDKRRIERAGDGLLPEACSWIFQHRDFQLWRCTDQNRLLWIRGDPGKGKTMLVCGIIDELERSEPKDNTLSYFFCQDTDIQINNATAVLRGLLYMLIRQQPSLASHVKRLHSHAGRTLFEDVNSWIAITEMFTNILHDPRLVSAIFIIDALDECRHGLQDLLQFISLFHASHSPRVKWLVSSRNWPDIERQLDKAEQILPLRLELNDESVSEAVGIYIQERVHRIAEEREYGDDLKAEVLQHLSTKSKGTFLWVALAYKSLQNVSLWNVSAKLRNFPSGLDAVYERMLRQIEQSDDNRDFCKQILRTVALVYRPITLEELGSVSALPEEVTLNTQWLTELVNLCGSFLTLQDGTVYFVHQSAREYLIGMPRNSIFPSGTTKVHHELFLKSLSIMSSMLRRNLCSPSSDCWSGKQDEALVQDPVGLRYSCVYWVDHFVNSFELANSRIDQKDQAKLLRFLREKCLYWLEALSCWKILPQGVLAIFKLQRLFEVFRPYKCYEFPLTYAQTMESLSELSELVHDTYRFILYFKQGIEIDPSQAYASGLTFSPTRSLLKRAFEDETRPVTMISPTEDQWPDCLQTLEGHSHTVSSVAFSQDLTRLASGSCDHTVKIWDASSGECLRTLKGHTSYVWSVAFSSTRLASASTDGTVRIWNIGSGECTSTLKAKDSIYSIVFSHDPEQLALKLYRNTVIIWDFDRGEYVCEIQGAGFAEAMAFSHDSTRLALTWDNSEIRIWDVRSKKYLRTLHGGRKSVHSMVFSHNSTSLASASRDGTVKLWDVRTVECIRTLDSCSDKRYSGFPSVAFSHDSTRLASARKRIIKIWDASSGECIRKFEDHTDDIQSIAFSHDSTRLASASCDRTIKIWDTSSSEYVRTHDSHNSHNYKIAFSHDSTRLVSSSGDNTVRIWDTSSGKCTRSLAVSSDPVAFSNDSKQLAVVSQTRNVTIWNVSSGKLRRTLIAANDYFITALAFSYDSVRLASGSGRGMVKIWDIESGECVRTLTTAAATLIYSLSFSYDCVRLASASLQDTVIIWDIESGKRIHTLHTSLWERCSLSFSRDSTRLSANLASGLVCVWDTGSGECLESAPQRVEPVKDTLDSQEKTAPSIDGLWIKQGKHRVWLPPEYRPCHWATSGLKLGMSCANGKVCIFTSND